MLEGTTFWIRPRNAASSPQEDLNDVSGNEGSGATLLSLLPP